MDENDANNGFYNRALEVDECTLDVNRIKASQNEVTNESNQEENFNQNVSYTPNCEEVSSKIEKNFLLN